MTPTQDPLPASSGVLSLIKGFTARSAVRQPQGGESSTDAALSAGSLTALLFVAPPDPLAFTSPWLLHAVILPLGLGYALVRWGSLAGSSLVRKGAIYAALSALIIAAYALIVAGLSLMFGITLPANSPIWIGGLVVILALALNPLRARLQGLLDRTLLQGDRAHAAAIERLRHRLERAGDLEAMSGALGEAIDATLAPASRHIFIYDRSSEQFTALPGANNRPSSEIRFSARGALAGHLSRTAFPLALDGKSVPGDLEADAGRLAALGGRLFVRLPGKERIAGWLAVGPRLSGEAYSARDVELLQSIADRASGVNQRLQALADLERRSQQTDAVTRVARGMNITLEFDDVLELIHAQTSQMMQLSDFRITLYDRDRDAYRLGFAVENNERAPQRGDQILPPNAGLEGEVVRSGRPILTQDYVRECHVRGVSPTGNGVGAWLGVPLNAGAETIGALSVGSRDAATTYTSGHVGLLQAVADQATGAIVKARLLQESQGRARQLSQLNDIARRLTSTLELEPLLQSIVEGSLSLLGCQGSILYLMDESASALVIRATAGAVHKAALGRRLSIGKGLAGPTALADHVVTTGEAVLDNQVQPQADDTLGQPGIGFTTRTSLAAPLQIQDRNVGVLQVMNRRDGLPFGDEDRTLLTALAGQAAVAVENVRLYMLTDQELAARVEELSVMQRIDRELNASLDSERAMRTTLEWALRQSNAEAGLIGRLDESSLRVVAHAGYGQALGGAAGESIDLIESGFQAAVDSGLPQQRDFAATGAGGLLPGSGHQTLIPIRREASVTGLLVLEGSGPPHEDLEFLSRLSDHAAIAISNAQLYDEVRRANAAKSEFVSLVAHELANPMTSIKGYAEILAAGSVGPITEMQADFLDTIRSNTERMSTLVSDLNDNSKIEAGQLRLDFRIVELAALVAETLQSSRQQIENKKQTVQLELPATLPGVWGDQTRLGQVLTNLISNANKYTPEGGVLTIGAETSANSWDPGGAREVVHLWVRDNGIGIRPDEAPRVFQKFFRSEDPKAREVPGVGLGLNITRSLVELQGGRIWFKSQHGRGTTFHFTVPVAET